MSQPRSPGLTAALDQEDAELVQHLDLLIATYLGMRGKSGDEIQSAANLVAFIPTQYGPIPSAALLVTAIRRLTAEGPQS